MQAKIEKIGDEFGLILPAELIQACGFGAEATVTVQDKTLVVTPAPRRPRDGWADALRNIPQEELDRDFEDLRAFRETPHSCSKATHALLPLRIRRFEGAEPSIT